MDDKAQGREPNDAGLGNDPIAFFGWKIRRKIAASLVTASFMLLGFVFLFTGYLEGGAFVSMLTLALGTGAIVLVWNRIEQFTLFGSEIKLHRLTRDAEKLLAGLDEGQVTLYRTALDLAQQASRSVAPSHLLHDSATSDVLTLLQAIERAGLLERLADEAFSATETAIQSRSERLLSRESPLHSAIREAGSQAPEDIPAIYDRWLAEANGQPTVAGHTVLDRSVAEIRELLRYKRKMEAMRHDTSL
ncbi:hypothetical protein GCM10027040_20180 [Halomonas shantousis]